MPARHLLRVIVCTAAICLLTACGQKGDLYLPKETRGNGAPASVAAAEVALAARRVHRHAQLHAELRATSNVVS